MFNCAMPFPYYTNHVQHYFLLSKLTTSTSQAIKIVICVSLTCTLYIMLQCLQEQKLRDQSDTFTSQLMIYYPLNYVSPLWLLLF